MILSEFQSLKPLEFFRKLDLSKLPKATAELIRSGTSEVKGLNLTQKSTTYHALVEHLYNEFPAALGVKPKELPKPKVEEKPIVVEEPKAEVADVNALQARLALVKRMAAKNKKDKALKVRIKLIKRMITEAKKKPSKKEHGGLISNVYDIVDINGKIIESNLTEQGLINFAITSSEYDRRDTGSEEITTVEDAIKWIEMDGDNKVIQKHENGGVLNPSEKKMVRDAAFANENDLEKANELIQQKLPVSKHQPAKEYMDTLFKNGGVIGEGKNGYVAFYKGKQMDVYADTSLQARDLAAKAFKAKKAWDVTVVLAEKEGKQVTHVADFSKGGGVGKSMYRVRKDLIEKEIAVPIGKDHVMDGEWEGKWSGDTLKLFHKGKWHEVESIDFDKVESLKAGGSISENWGGSGATPSNNEDYNNLYAMFPDNHSEAKAIWEQLSQKQKDGFINDLEVTDAASEGNAESWLEFINAPSYEKGGKVLKKGSSMAKGGSTDSDTPKVYIADLAAYNEGKLVGEWLDLSDFSSGEEVMEKISELLKKWSDEQGVEREEYAVHDSEGFPDSMYSEAMGEDSFQEVIDLHEALDDSDFSMEVIEKYMNYKGHSSFSESIEEMKDNYVGKYDDIEDFAYETVESMGGIEGISDADRYLYVTDTDRRLVSNEQADDDIENMDDDDILERAEMKDEYDEAIDNEKEEEAEAILEKAKEAVHDEIYEEWHKGLEDPYSFLVDEQGLYDSKSILKANFVVFDYKEFGEALEQDYHVIETDGDIMVFQYN